MCSIWFAMLHSPYIIDEEFRIYVALSGCIGNTRAAGVHSSAPHVPSAAQTGCISSDSHVKALTIRHYPVLH